MLAVAFAAPKILAAPNRLWFKFGMWLGGIVAPIVMGVIYLLFITPYGFFLRLVGKRFLELKFDPDAKSYWVRREPDPEASMRNQF